MRRTEKVTDPPTGVGFARLGLDFFVTFVGRYATLNVVVAILQQMAPILPAGQHNGTLLRKWTCDAFTISEVQYAARAKYAWHGNEHALLVVTEKGCCAKQTDRKSVV